MHYDCNGIAIVSQIAKLHLMSTRLTMICAGATVSARKARFPLDEPLEARAIALAKELRPRLRRADQVWSSPALRAKQTAAALALEPAVVPILQDLDFAQWSGKPIADVSSEDPNGMAAWLSDPTSSPHGGESLADAPSRASSFMTQLLTERGHMVVVTHAAFVRAAILLILEAPLQAAWRLDVEPLSITDFRGDGRRWVLRSIWAR